ncbi:MAG: TraB/GumN family protein [Spirochaetaceae bacterium]|jgi:pheromone shutdown-related protein TraB|nr:TraB/GumN family protein [Spirochaetaceae bacterium]
MDEQKETQVYVNASGKNIVLIGTAHISLQSIDEVANFIESKNPALVCVEIDSGRYDSMTGGDAWQKLDMIKVFREGRGFLMIANLVLSSFQKRLGMSLGVKPGSDMKAAIDIAKARNIPFAFCDREVHITLRRAWAKCGLWSRCKLISVLLSSVFTREELSGEDIENLKHSSELDGMMNELSKFLPEIKTVLIDERDYYLAARIWQESSPGELCAAVVGAGHLAGIKNHIENFARESETAVNLEEIEKIPKAGIAGKIIEWLIPLLIAAFVVVGIASANFGLVKEGLFKWLILNGSLAALGAAAALAHPLTVLISFVGAPIGTLSPFISVGLFSGLAEAALRRPKVIDAERLVEDATTIKGIYRNRITRILLVFFLASLGGVIGNLISFTSLARLFSSFIG